MNRKDHFLILLELPLYKTDWAVRCTEERSASLGEPTRLDAPVLRRYIL